MADNLSVTAGSGSTIGMDEVVDGTLGTVKVGFGKIMDGTLDGTDKLKITTENAAQVAGDKAHDAADAGNPVKIGGKARSGAPADVTANDRVDAYFDLKGRLKTDGSDVTQPVSGTVTANLSATDNAVLDAIEADTTTIAGAVSGSEMQVDVVTSALPSGAATSAKQDDQTTALQLIDDTVFTDDTSTHAAGTTKGIGIMAAATPTDTAVNANDIGMLAMNTNRQLLVDGSGVTQPVSNAGLTSLNGAISGTEVQVDVLTMPTTNVQATNLDIRDIDAATDDITVHGDVGVLDQLDLTNSNPAAVAIVDGDGTQITSFGGGTQYTEDAVAAANPVGTALTLIREDARAGGLTTTDGDNVAARGNNKGELYVKTTDSDALLTTIDADTGNISTKIDTVAGAVSGSEMQVDVVTSALPSGAATAANQTTGNTSVGNIDTNLGAIADASVAAGATGSVSAKLRRLTADTDAIKTAVTGTLTVTGGGGGTEYTEDAAAAADPVGKAAILVRKDTPATVTSTDGDNIAQRGTNYGAAYTQIVTSAGAYVDTFGGGVEYDAGDAVVGNTTGKALVFEDGGFYSTVASGTPLPVTTGNPLTDAQLRATDVGVEDATVAGLLTDGSQKSQVEGYTAEDSPWNPAGSAPVALGAYASTATKAAVSADGDAVGLWADRNGRLRVTGDASMSPVLTTESGIAGVIFTDDTSTHATGTTKGLGIMAVADPTDAAVSANDIGMVAMTLSRAMKNDITSIAGTAAVSGSGTATGALRVELPTNGTGVIAGVTTLTGGGVASGSGDSGNPVKVGARVETALSTATMEADADRIDLLADADGALLVRSNFPLGDLLTDATSNTDGASTASGVFTATASTRSVITAIHVFRTDAGTTPIYIDFRDGTAGSVLWRMALPPNGGSVITDPTGLFRTTANTALAYDVSAATTTVYINVSGFKSKV